MNHEELVKRFDGHNYVMGCNECSCISDQCQSTHILNHLGRKNREAIMKVLDLHKPEVYPDTLFHNCEYCRTPYPCQTIKLVMEVMEDVNPYLSSSTHT